MLRRFYYDLHLHSCLSPCGDNDNTPQNIVGMASLCALDIIALTDHNTTKNCPAFFEAAEKFGIIPIAGMELTTSEDIHVVCLFEALTDAARFDAYVAERRVLIKNKPEFFGEQLIIDADETVIGTEEYLLTNATEISVDEIYDIARGFGGVAYPAHIDKDANSITAILGTVPSDSKFTLYELHSAENADGAASLYGIDKNRFIISSDAHYLTDMRDKDAYLTLEVSEDSPSSVRSALFEFLRGDTI
jgi:PHP family Zn ribbon phosphoesterase